MRRSRGSKKQEKKRTEEKSFHTSSSDKAAEAISAVLFVAAFVVLRTGGASSASLVRLPVIFFQPFSALTVLLGALAALLLVTAGLAVLAALGYRNDRRVIIPPAIGALAAILLLGFTIASFFAALGLILACIYVVPLANTYGKELKRWIFFRVGTNSVSRALMAVNIMLAIGVGLTIYSDMQGYQGVFKEGMKSIIGGFVPSELSGEFQANPVLAEKALDAPAISRYLAFLPILSALEAWVALEFLRAFILSNVAGAITSAILRTKKHSQ